MRRKKDIKKCLNGMIMLAIIYVSGQALLAEERRKKVIDEDEITQTMKDMGIRLSEVSSVEFIKSDRSVIVTELKDLTRRSTSIIIGRPLANKSYYDDELDEVRTMRLVQVQTVLKGNMENGNTIELEMPGGAYVRRNGETGYRRMSESRAVREEVSYFIFMRESKDNEKTIYQPSAGIQGIFEIDPETHAILPCDMVKSSPMVKRYENMVLEDFMNELMTALSAESSQRW